MEVLDGVKTSNAIKEEIRKEVLERKEKGLKTPHLAAVLVGTDGASETYVNAKVKDCHQVGFKSTLIRLPESISEEDLLTEIQDLNEDKDIDGFIVQLPLPNHIDELKITETVLPHKDVDGFHPQNIGKMVLNQDGFIPATPYGIVKLLEYYKIETEGKHCVVVGRSNIVGKPMSILMARSGYPGNATVTITHSRTKNLTGILQSADIVIAAVGNPEFIKADMIKAGAVVIDVGITRVDAPERKRGYKLKGDIDYESVAPKCSFITPVPGGVGPMTRVSLMINTLKAVKMKES